MKENDICHIACVKRYLYNNNLFPANLEQLIIMTEVATCISVRLLNHIDWEFDQVGWSRMFSYPYCKYIRPDGNQDEQDLLIPLL